MISIKKAFFLSLLVLGVPFLASAQTPTSTNPVTGAVAYANVDLSAYVFGTSTDTFIGGYTLQGNMGQQNDLDVGIITVDSKGMIIDATPLKQNLSLQEGQSFNGTFTYTIPAYLKGKVSVYIKAETDSGLPLGMKKLADKNLSGTGQTLTCSLLDAKGTAITCTSTVDTSITASYAHGGWFAKPITEEKKDAKKGEKVTFTPTNLPGGRTVAHISANGESHSIIFFVRTGGSISNVVVTQDPSGQLKAVVIATSYDPATNVNLTLTSSSGGACGTASGRLLGAAAQLLIATKCKEGTATVDLVGADGSKLDSKSETFSIIPFAEQGSGSALSSNNMKNNFLYALGGALVLAAAYLVIRKRFPISAASIALFLAFFMATANAHAGGSAVLTFIDCTSACPATASLYVNIQDDASIWAVGETAWSYAVLSSDDNPQYLDNSCGQTACVAPVVKVSSVLDQNGSYGADLFPNNFTQQQTRNTQSSMTWNEQGTTLSSSGNHNLWFTAGSAGYNTVTTSFPVTVYPGYCDVQLSHWNSGQLEGTTDHYFYPGQSWAVLYSNNINQGSAWSSRCVYTSGLSCPPTWDSPSYGYVSYKCQSGNSVPSVNVQFQ